MNEYLVRISNCETGEVCEQIIYAKTRVKALSKFMRRWKKVADNPDGAEWTVMVMKSFVDFGCIGKISSKRFPGSV